jgi:hypothetical protein
MLLSLAAPTSIALLIGLVLPAPERASGPQPIDLPGAQRSASQRAVAPRRTEPIVPEGAVALPASVIASLRDSFAPTLDLPLPEGGTLRVHCEPLTTLAPGARVVVASRDQAGIVTESEIAPAFRSFALQIDGRTDAKGALTIIEDADGLTLGGFVSLPERTLWISNGPRTRGLVPIVFDASMVDPALLPPPGSLCATDEIAHPPAGPAGGAEGGVAGGSPNACREVDIAIDTDWEFTANLFNGNTSAAAAYALALTAATSEIFTDDLNVRLRVSYLRLWTGANGASDPWDQTSTVNQLFQYRDYWVANESGLERDLGHFLSGRGLGGGVAWLPGLCGGDFSFGLSANLGGGFPYPLIDNSGANWDIMVYAHELGHNFGSPHTHSYDPPLDGCGNGDCSAANTGTIMSYCHTCSGGLTNVALSFHPGNIATMSEFLAGTACDFSGGAQPASAMDDVATAGAGSLAIVDPLFNDERVNCEAVSIASFDATTASGAAVTLIPAPVGGRPTFSVAVPVSATGDDSFNYTITDELGSTDTATVTIDVLPLLPATPVVGTTAKIDVDYYALSLPSVLPDFSTLTPYLSAQVTQVNFASTGGAFASSGRNDEVGAVFTGWLDVPTTGFYTLFVESDDGSRLFIDDTLIIDNDGLHGMVERSGVVGLAAGKHAFRVEFFENGGGAGVIARWQGPGIPKQVIPGANLSRGGTVVGPDLDGNGSVDASDLAILLGAWGGNDPTKDLNADGAIDAADLAILLGAWG